MDKNNDNPSLAFRLTTIGLAAPALLLIVVCLFALQEILLTMAAPAIASASGDSVRARYALVTLRNFWLLFGGTVATGLLIYSLDRLFKHSAKRRTRLYFQRMLAVEMVIIVVQLAVA